MCAAKNPKEPDQLLFLFCYTLFVKNLFFGVGGVVIFLAGLYFFWPEAAITNYPSDGTTVVAFGDSLVEGVGATEGNDFVSLVSQEIGEPIINLGVSGNTTELGLARLDEVLAKNPKIVILLLGGNDFIRRIPRATTESNLKVMIERIQAQGAIVLLLGVRGGILRDGFDAMYEDLSETYSTAYVPDVLDGLFGDSTLMADGIHPNDAGYKIIAERVAEELKPLLK